MAAISPIVGSRPGYAAPASRKGSAAPAAGVQASAQVQLSAPAAAATYTDRIKKSGKLRIDALLAGGDHWFHEAGASGAVPSATAKKTLTYSFLQSAEGLNASDARGFRALNGGQQQRVRDALAYYSSIIDVRFEEVASGGDLKYGANQQQGSAGYARYPGHGSEVMLAANDNGFNGSWAEGSYAWQVLLHETAHAIGLKHPGNYNAGGGGTPGPYLGKGDDHRGNTIMSYYNAPNMRRVVASGQQLSQQNVVATTLQGLDVAALQYLYGASTTTSAATYSWETDAVVSQTVWNPNAGSAIDLSNQTKNNLVDLRAGRWSSIGMRDAYADTGMSAEAYGKLTSGGRKVADILGKPSYDGRNNLFIANGSRITEATGGSGNDTFVANAFDNTLAGGDGNDRFFWSGGNLSVDGGDGRDVVLVKKVAGASWRLSDDKSTLTLTDAKQATLGTISLAGVEAVRFWDGSKLKATGPVLYSA